MKVCEKCFLDNEIIGFINARSTTLGPCDFCDSENENLIDVEELYDFFQELFDNFQLKEDGETLTAKIQNNWSLFGTDELAIRVMDYILPQLQTNIKNSENLVDFTEDIRENVNYWEILKNNIKWERRYVTDIDYLTGDLGWDSFLSDKVTLDKNKEYFRARLHYKESTVPYKPDEMYAPPCVDSSAGRANPAGIPFLYLCDNESTVLYEIRAAFLDEVTIGRFSLKDSIKEEISIADFTQKPSVFRLGEVDKSIKSTLLKDLISRDLSKPMRRYDSEIDYIPTQFICEFIKVFAGVHGIKFRSSLHPEGNNLVIFDQNIMECKSVEKVRVKNVIIST